MTRRNGVTIAVAGSLAVFAVGFTVASQWLATAPAGQRSAVSITDGIGPGVGSGIADTGLDPAQVDRGQAVFESKCQSCHGPEAEGERPGDPGAVDANRLPLAPALNGSMHAWHHTDDGLVATILQGSPRNPRMIAWSKAGLSEADARDVVAYLKSLWGPVERRCQGPGHMDRNCLMGSGS